MKKYIGIFTMMILTSITLTFAGNLQDNTLNFKEQKLTEKPINSNFSFGLSYIGYGGKANIPLGLGVRYQSFGLSLVVGTLGLARMYSIEPNFFLQLNETFALQTLVGHSIIGMKGGIDYTNYVGPVFGLGIQANINKMIIGCNYRYITQTNCLTKGFFMVSIGAPIK